MFVCNAAAAANGVASKMEVIAMSELEIADKNKSLMLGHVFGEALAVLNISDDHHLQVINGSTVQQVLTVDAATASSDSDINSNYL